MSNSSITVDTEVTGAAFADTSAPQTWDATTRDVQAIPVRLNNWKDWVDAAILNLQTRLATDGAPVVGSPLVVGTGHTSSSEFYVQAGEGVAAGTVTDVVAAPGGATDAAMLIASATNGETVSYNLAVREGINNYRCRVSLTDGDSIGFEQTRTSGSALPWNFVDSSTIVFAVSGAGAISTIASTQGIPGRYTQQVDFADLGSGATDTIAFPSLPDDEIMVGIGLTIATAWTSSSGNTTGLDLEVGTSGDPNRFGQVVDLIGLSTGANIIPNGAGSSEVTGDTGQLLFTATGGAPDLDDIDAGDLTVTLYTLAL